MYAKCIPLPHIRDTFFAARRFICGLYGIIIATIVVATLRERRKRLSQDYYELLVLAARYVFALLGVVVVWRAANWLRQDFRERRWVKSALPDAGYIGTLHVMEGQSKRLIPGDSLPLPTEGVLGSGAGCDVRVSHATVGRRHALFEFRPDGLHLRPYRDERLQVDGHPLPQGCEAILAHGAMLTLGGVMLQLRLFAGIQAITDFEPELEPEFEFEAEQDDLPAPQSSTARGRRKG